MCKMINVDKVSKKYEMKQALAQVSVQFMEGSITGIIGPNGAGKTTLMKCLTGLVIPSEGKIEIGKYMMPKDRDKILQKIGAVIEVPVFYEHLSGLDNLKLELKARGATIKDDWVEEMVNLFDVKTYLNKKVKKYSLGMRQRLSICRALVHKPDILILDEPTNGLDVEGKDCLWEGLKELCDKHNMTILVSSHSLGELEINLESFFIMKDGQIISSVKRDEINQYYLVRIENIQDFADAAEKLTILSKNSQNQAIVKMKKDTYKDLVERNGKSFRHRHWQLIDEYYFVMQKENHTWGI